MEICSPFYWSLPAHTYLHKSKAALPSIFDFDKYEISAQAAAQLDSFVTAIQSEPSAFTIELFGHCDSSYSLSWKRWIGKIEQQKSGSKNYQQMIISFLHNEYASYFSR